MCRRDGCVVGGSQRVRTMMLLILCDLVADADSQHEALDIQVLHSYSSQIANVEDPQYRTGLDPQLFTAR